MRIVSNTIRKRRSRRTREISELQDIWLDTCKVLLPLLAQGGSTMDIQIEQDERDRYQQELLAASPFVKPDKIKEEKFYKVRISYQCFDPI
jgi:hypothetical protein